MDPDEDEDLSQICDYSSSSCLQISHLHYSFYVSLKTPTKRFIYTSWFTKKAINYSLMLFLHIRWLSIISFT